MEERYDSIKFKSDCRELSSDIDRLFNIRDYDGKVIFSILTLKIVQLCFAQKEPRKSFDEFKNAAEECYKILMRNK